MALLWKSNDVGTKNSRAVSIGDELWVLRSGVTRIDNALSVEGVKVAQAANRARSSFGAFNSAVVAW